MDSSILLIPNLSIGPFEKKKNEDRTMWEGESFGQKVWEANSPKLSDIMLLMMIIMMHEKISLKKQDARLS